MPPSLYKCTTRHTAVELIWQDTALIHDRKSALFAYKPCRLNASFVRWFDVCFFWAHTPEAHALKHCQTTPDYWTKLSFKLIRSKHTRFTYIIQVDAAHWWWLRRSPLLCKALWVPRKALYKCNIIIIINICHSYFVFLFCYLERLYNRESSLVVLLRLLAK